jgi:maltose alpha-D-glucosyltransferase/alpha-amylase
VDYWLDFGIDGFRADAVPYLYEREGTNCENLPETHEFLKKLRAHIEKRYPNAVLLAEANQWPEDVVEYFGEGDEFHMGYHFPIMPRLFMALRQEDRKPIVEILERTPDIPANCQWGMFLRNHDELTLEMVTDEERDYLYNEYAKDRRMRLNVGIRRRLAPLLDNSHRRIQLLHALLFSLPGSPFLYYGDEIGMGDNIYLGDRDGVRTPMQWTSDRNAGFSKADFEKLYFPVINNPVYGFQSVNVDSQLRYDTSLLNWMRQMILLRKQHHVFGRGTMRFVKPENRKVFAFVREHDDDRVLCVFNLSQFAQPVELDLAEFEGWTPVEMLGKTRFPAVRAGAPYQLALAPFGFYWFQLERLGA